MPNNNFRYKCPACGEVFDAPLGTPCPKCGAALPSTHSGMIQIYRMGSPIGIAVGYGLYLDGQPYGHLGNKQTVRIATTAGTHTLHATCGATRRCRDLTFTLDENTRIAYIKAHIKPGFWSNEVVLEYSTPEEMPPV